MGSTVAVPPPSPRRANDGLAHPMSSTCRPRRSRGVCRAADRWFVGGLRLRGAPGAHIRVFACSRGLRGLVSDERDREVGVVHGRRGLFRRGLCPEPGSVGHVLRRHRSTRDLVRGEETRTPTTGHSGRSFCTSTRRPGRGRGDRSTAGLRGLVQPSGLSAVPGQRRDLRSGVLLELDLRRPGCRGRRGVGELSGRGGKRRGRVVRPQLRRDAAGAPVGRCHAGQSQGQGHVDDLARFDL